jgi:hypothetical protein
LQKHAHEHNDDVSEVFTVEQLFTQIVKDLARKKLKGTRMSSRVSCRSRCGACTSDDCSEQRKKKKRAASPTEIIELDDDPAVMTA